MNPDPAPNSRLPDRTRLDLVTNEAAEAEPTSPVERILSKAGELSVLPQVVCQVVEAASNQDTSAKTLEATIQVDPGFSAKLIAQANSAYFSLPNKVSSIREAVMFLGLDEIRRIAMTVGVFDMFVGKTDEESLRRRAWWRHSLDTAVFCRVASESMPMVNEAEAYTCGLLHWIGKTILDRFDPAQYSKVQKVVDQGAPDVLAERAVFQCDHIAVALGAAARWGFPELLVAGLDYFTPAHDHNPENSLRACTALGSRIVRFVRSGHPADDIGMELIPGWILDSLGLSENMVKTVICTGASAVDSMPGHAL